MPEIQVIFPAADPSSTQVTVAQVLAPTVVARERERITWLFYNCDPRIQFAEVEFANRSHKFFLAGGTQESHKFKKGIAGNGDIYGEVPDLSANRPVSAKYTVRGWGSSQNKCSEVDPEILVNEP